MTLLNQTVWHYRAAILNLAVLRLRVRYNNSALGFLWSLGNPLFFMVVFTFVFTVLLDNAIPNYPIFALSAIMPWNFFSGALLNIIASVPQDRDLLTKLSFPREILPFASVLSDFINFGVAIIAITLILIVVGQGAGIVLLALPLLMLILVLFTAGLGMLLATVNVWFRDVQEIMSVLIFGWFFITPIVYSLDEIKADFNGLPVKQMLQIVNPMAGIISSFRQVLYAHEWPAWDIVGLAAAISVVMFIIGLAVYHTFSPRFAEEV
ncbi:MAG: ABC transporter permease [Anaerolineae bacterium]|nr:ABC transporter permease [Anaerolineae bacterium]